MSDVQDDRMTATVPRYTRRLSDKILVAFHHACDQGDFEVAERLLKVAEMTIASPRLSQGGTERRRDKENPGRGPRTTLAASASRIPG